MTTLGHEALISPRGRGVHEWDCAMTRAREATLLPFHHVRCSYKACIGKAKSSPDRTSADNLTLVFSASRLVIHDFLLFIGVPSSWYFATTARLERGGTDRGPVRALEVTWGRLPKSHSADAGNVLDPTKVKNAIWPHNILLITSQNWTCYPI